MGAAWVSFGVARDTIDGWEEEAEEALQHLIEEEDWQSFDDG